MDKRDLQPWVALELTPFGEMKAQSGDLATQIRRDLGIPPEAKHPEIFVPVRTHQRGRRTLTIALVQGYVFVEAGLEETKYFRLERYAYCEHVISSTGSNGLRSIHTIPSAEVTKMKLSLAEMVASDLQVGQRVKVVGGRYKGMTGVISLLDPKEAVVSFELRSLHIICGISRILLEPEESL